MSLPTMDSIPAEFPISLQSWPSKNKDSTSALPALISRINLERGGFRNITEDGLRKEIAEAEAGEGQDSSSDEEEEEKPDRMKELLSSRDEMMQTLE
jgi:mediator of RNA polymerase II transcription subunit 17